MNSQNAPWPWALGQGTNVSMETRLPNSKFKKLKEGSIERVWQQTAQWLRLPAAGH